MDYFFQELDILSLRDEQWAAAKLRLANATGGERRLFGLASGDLFHLPRRFFNQALPMLELLGKYHIFLEIGVVSALRPLSDSFQLIDNTGHDAAGGIRNHKIEDVYSTSLEMLHPFKIGNIRDSFHNSDETGRSCVYCNLIRITSALKSP